MNLLPAFTATKRTTLGGLLNRVWCCDALDLLRALPDGSVNCFVTSPPYFGLRDYGHENQIGLEPTPQEYVQALVTLFREARRVLRDDGTFWLNLGDSYANDDKWGGATGGMHAKELHGNTSVGRGKKSTGLPPKSRMMIPARVAIALQDDGWILRDEIVWHKPNPMPESVKDRTTKAHEMIYMFSKCPQYFYDNMAIQEKSAYGDKDRRAGKGRFAYDGKYNGNTNGEQQAFVTVNEYRNRRSVWTVTTKPLKEAHFAAFPMDLIEPMILAGCPSGGVVYDPFMGSGTTALVARQHGRNFIGSELNPEYVAIANKRLDMPYTPRLFEDGAA